MTRIIIEYNSDDFWGIMIQKLDKILDAMRASEVSPKITIDFDYGELNKK